MRPTHVEIVANLAYQVRRRSTCSARGSVGAVIYDGYGRIISTGYNGSPSGFPHCDEVGCVLDEGGHCVYAVHAEVNALIQCMAYGIPTRGLHLFTTSSPCNRCATMIVRCGIACVRYSELYRPGPEFDRTRKIFELGNVGFYAWGGNEELR